jgi:predicted SAM-dependent methyltransferase
MDQRTSFLRSMLPLDGSGLEIGPGYNPLLPRSEGFRVETVDYTDQAGLRDKYKGNPHVNVDRIETVDHVVSEGKTLSEAVRKYRAFDYIVASHVIEHTPDMVGFLQSCGDLLNTSGVLVLAVPDKRYCFDVLQPLTSTGDVLQAHLERRIMPTPGAVFDSLAYDAVREDHIGWGPDDARSLRFFASLKTAANTYQSLCRFPTYHDVHVWRFVPSSFRLIISDLYEIQEIRLREDQFHDTVGNEFYVSLTESASGCSCERLALAKKALHEHAAILVD